MRPAIVDRAVAQRRRKQAQRMQRLAQIVVCGGEEPRFRAARFFGAHARLFGKRVLMLQLLDELLVLVAQADLRR